MRRRFWLTLDRAGHALPLLRFGRVRYAICLRADRYIMEGVPEGEDWLEALKTGRSCSTTSARSRRSR